MRKNEKAIKKDEKALKDLLEERKKERRYVVHRRKQKERKYVFAK